MSAAPRPPRAASTTTAPASPSPTAIRASRRWRGSCRRAPIRTPSPCPETQPQARTPGGSGRPARRGPGWPGQRLGTCGGGSSRWRRPAVGAPAIMPLGDDASMSTTPTPERLLAYRRRYFSDAKPAFLRLIDPRDLRVLDLGCGGGHNGALLKRAGAREVIGVELDAGAAAQARERLDGVVCSDLVGLDLAGLGDEPFDAILASDVLEHLAEPEAVLAQVLTRLRPGGAVVVSLPNVAHVCVFASLLLKRWPRKSSGIFDRTHLRFFAKWDMVALLEGAGLRVLRVEPYYTRYAAIRAACLVLSLYVFRDFWARQFLLLAEKPR